jgi:ribose transport system ATP-binding protein
MNIKKNTILKVEGISKTFPGVKALSELDLDILEGEVHAVVGENGAGKSTLMKILSGVYHQETGRIFMFDKEIKLTSTTDALRLGISCIYQELTIVPLLDVAKNLFIGNLPLNKARVIDTRKLYKDAKEVLNLLKMDISPNMLCGDLSIAKQQMIEIGRAISRKAKIIIMDEPTSSLTDKEKEVLFSAIRHLREKGISIIYVSHKLEEVKEIADRITVLRDGFKVKTISNEEVTREEIIELMIGRKLDNYFIKEDVKISGAVLKVEGLTKQNVFYDINFEVRKGEVLGLFGLVGAGRSEIAEVIFGIEHAEKGSISIDGKLTKIKSTGDAIKQGIYLVPEDRKLQGLVLKLSVIFNMTLVKIREISRFGHINRQKEKDIAEKFINFLNIKTPSLKQTVSNLSGGNQQKVVISKWLSMEPKVLILDEPTRGIDVGAKTEIYAIVNELVKKGVGIILISSELPEIMGICDRIITIFEGKSTAIFERDIFNSNSIMKASLGEELF